MSDFKLDWRPPRGVRSRNAQLTWDGAPYAPIVYFGATLRNGGRIPGRRWIDDPQRGALTRVDLEQEYARAYRRTRDFREAFRIASEALAEASRDAISDRRWPWPQATERQSGEIAGTLRDIVDTGRLLRSQRGPFLR